jgi:GTP-binding protein Era
MTDQQTRCGVIAIIGEPNAGKSTLINQLVGGKVSIVTPKVQTTRFNIRGLCVSDNAQLIFVDTPGIFDAAKSFEKAMVQAAWSGIGDADAVLMLLDAKQGLRDSTRQIVEALKKNKKKPICLAINKVDTIDKPDLFALATACDNFKLFDRIFMISALKGDGVKDVTSYLASQLPPGPFLYPEDHMSDIPMRLLAAEVTREKLFMNLDQELPYSIFVETESWDETDTSITIAQAITVQREGQKKIVIGEKGAMIKAVGTASRIELSRLTDKKVHLNLFVKVRSGWKDDSENYRSIGLEYKK